MSSDPPPIVTWSDRLHARAAGLSRGARAFVRPPEPHGVGTAARGDQIVGGRFMFHGYVVEAGETPVWDLDLPEEPGFVDALHAMVWLDDLAAQGTRRAETLAAAWVHDWVRRYGRGTGLGWRATLTGRRIARWIDHAQMILRDADTPARRRFFRALSRQTAFLARRVGTIPPGADRIEALGGLLRAGLALNGFGRHRDRAARAMARDVSALIGADGTLPTRNPEDLSRIFVQVALAADGLRAADAVVPAALPDMLARVAPVLRDLRHADGALPRFHGGGRGHPGQLDRALALARVPVRAAEGRAMGFVRLSQGRTSLVIDAAPPPEGPGSAQAHASTLAFELTSGRRPLIVSCGSGAAFGARWRRAGRATPSHSTLAIDGYSSSRLGALGDDLLSDAPRDVRIERRRTDRSTGLVAGHDGYIRTHGLTHVRQLFLDTEGRALQGEDVLATVEREDEDIFDRAIDASDHRRIPFRIRFHVHPDVAVEADATDRQTVFLMSRGGELWTFTHTGSAALGIEPSVYLDTVSLSPRATRQIVLTSSAVDYATRVSWTLAKGRQTPDAVRDIVHDDRPVLV